MNPETILDRVCRALDIAIGLGANYGGLFPSIIDRSTHQMMVDMPPAIAGQRDGDRSHLGSNLGIEEVEIVSAEDDEIHADPGNLVQQTLHHADGAAKHLVPPFHRTAVPWTRSLRAGRKVEIGQKSNTDIVSDSRIQQQDLAGAPDVVNLKRHKWRGL